VFVYLTAAVIHLLTSANDNDTANSQGAAETAATTASSVTTVAAAAAETVSCNKAADTAGTAF